MLQEIPLIKKKNIQGSTQYQICKDGLTLLRTLRTKKLRIIFNITHQKINLNTFNGWLLGIDQQQTKEKPKEDVCLTISKHCRQLEEERVILIFNAYEQPQTEPFMVLLGYLASSVFLYHHFAQALSEQSSLTHMLCRLKQLLTATDINDLNREMTIKKGYSKNPHFLCLLPISSAQEDCDSFKQFYRYSEGGSEAINEAVDALIDFLPERSSLALAITKEEVNKIGKQFQENVLGREIFNFELTGSTVENLCFECCETFNHSKSLNLSAVYSKIIENQKCRLEDQANQRYMSKISSVYFHGGKIDYNGFHVFPMNSSELLEKHNEIATNILDETVKLASYCMNLSQYKKMHESLRNKFNKTFSEMENSNNQKTEQFCRECFQLLENIEIGNINSSTLSDLFREISNKLQLYVSQSSQAIGKDSSFKIFTNYLSRLQSNILQKLRQSTVQALENYELKIQQYKVQKQDLKYNIRVLQNKMRQLQYQYNLQEDILNEYKMKLIHQPEPEGQQSYSSDLNKFRKRIQQLEEEVQDKDLYVEQLEGIIERFEGLTQRDKLKYKFSKEIVEMIKDVSNEVNNCHTFIKEAKKTNELYDEIKEGFAKQRQSIIDQRKKALQDISTKQAQFQKIIKEKTQLQEIINQARQSILVYKQVDQSYKEGISNLENTYTQAQCLLAETENQLELFKKAMSLVSEQQAKGGKLEALNKFYKVSTNSELRDLLKPFLKK